MSIHRKLFIALALTLIGAGCVKQIKEVKLGEKIQLSRGEIAQITDLGIKLKLKGVEIIDTCPSGAQCIVGPHEEAIIVFYLNGKKKYVGDTINLPKDVPYLVVASELNHENQTGKFMICERDEDVYYKCKDKINTKNKLIPPAAPSGSILPGGFVPDRTNEHNICVAETMGFDNVKNLLDKANQIKDIDRLVRIESTINDLCYVMHALRWQDADLCAKVTDQEGNLSKEIGQLIAELTRQTYSGIALRDQCFMRMAALTRQEKFCNQVKGDYLQSSCVELLSRDYKELGDFIIRRSLNFNDF